MAVGAAYRLTRTSSNNVVIDRGVIILDDTVVGEDPIEDTRRFEHTTNGTTLIMQTRTDRRAPTHA